MLESYETTTQGNLIYNPTVFPLSFHNVSIISYVYIVLISSFIQNKTFPYIASFFFFKGGFTLHKWLKTRVQVDLYQYRVYWEKLFLTLISVTFKTFNAPHQLHHGE